MRPCRGGGACEIAEMRALVVVRLYTLVQQSVRDKARPRQLASWASEPYLAESYRVTTASTSMCAMVRTGGVV